MRESFFSNALREENKAIKPLYYLSLSLSLSLCGKLKHGSKTQALISHLKLLYYTNIYERRNVKCVFTPNGLKDSSF